MIEWCPKEDSPLSVRNMLSTLKKARCSERRRSEEKQLFCHQL